MKVFGIPRYYIIEKEMNVERLRKDWPVLVARMPVPMRNELRMISLKVSVEERNEHGYTLKLHSPFGIVRVLLERSKMQGPHISIVDSDDVVILGGVFFIFSEIHLDMVNNTPRKVQLDPIDVLRYALFTGDWRTMPYFIQSGITFKLKDIGVECIDDSLEGLIKLGDYLHKRMREVKTSRMLIAMPDVLKNSLDCGKVTGNSCLCVQLTQEKISFLLEVSYSEDYRSITGVQLFKAKGKECYFVLDDNKE